ncbi:hypothetical protein ACMG5I_15260, partial [Escherichia coli]
MFTATEAVPVAKVVAGNKRYPGVVALDNVNFTLNKGEVRALGNDSNLLIVFYVQIMPD